MKQGLIVAIEGPSGSGKDYWLSQNTVPGVSNVLTHSGMPRQRSPEFGAYSSSSQEMNSIIFATMMGETVYTNRFLLSRWVYRAFEEDGLPYTWRLEMAQSLARMKEFAIVDAVLRNPLAVPYKTPSIMVHVLLPPLPVLKRQRAISGRAYPFNVEQELEYYREITETLIYENPIDGLYISVVPPSN